MILLLCLLCASEYWTGVKSDRVIDLLDELIAKSGYNLYDEPVGDYNYAKMSYSPVPAVGGYGGYDVGYGSPYSYSPPAYSPPVYSPPVYSQPAYSPPAYSPPTYSPPAYSPPVYSPPAYSPPVQTGYSASPPSYGTPVRSGYQQNRPMHGSTHSPSGYDDKKKVFIPVAVKKQAKKKMKIITVQKGFYIVGGTQLFGKFKNLKSCQKACAASPTCFSGDYNPWLKKCYMHSNFTACGTLRAHKQLVHFKKVPCSFPEAPTGRVVLGAALNGGIEQKGVKSLSDCVKACATTGKGIPANGVFRNLHQRCFGVDYDFSSHKCFFHTNNWYPANLVCPLAPVANTAPPVPRDLRRNPNVVFIQLCPGVVVAGG